MSATPAPDAFPLPARKLALSIRLEADTLHRVQAVARRLGVSTSRVLLGLVAKQLPAAEADPGALLVADAVPSEPR